MDRAAPKLVLSSETTAVTYSFVGRTASDGFKSWALCTVNDATGELGILSDWGSWSYRWHASPESLGARNLTTFLGDRTSVDYLARKLQREGHSAYRFSARKTAAALRDLLLVRRLEDGRDQIDAWWHESEEGRPPPCDRYEENGRPIFSWRTPRACESGRPLDEHGRPYGKLPYLSPATARGIWKAIGELAEDLHHVTGGEHLFWERVQQIDGFTEYVTDVAYEHCETEQTPEDRILRETILPALIEACAATARRRGHIVSAQAVQA